MCILLINIILLVFSHPFFWDHKKRLYKKFPHKNKNFKNWEEFSDDDLFPFEWFDHSTLILALSAHYSVKKIYLLNVTLNEKKNIKNREETKDISSTLSHLIPKPKKFYYRVEGTGSLKNYIMTYWHNILCNLGYGLWTPILINKVRLMKS